MTTLFETGTTVRRHPNTQSATGDAIKIRLVKSTKAPKRRTPAKGATLCVPVESGAPPAHPDTDLTILPCASNSLPGVSDEVLTPPRLPLSTAAMQLKIRSLESQLEGANANLERVTALLEVAENEIRRLHQQLESAAPPPPSITINGGTFHLYGGAP